MSTVTKQELLSLELYRCAHDFWYWLRNFGYMEDGKGNIIGPGIDLWDGQREYQQHVEAGEDVIAGKARQVGASWLQRNRECHDIMFHDGIHDSIIGNDDRQAMEQLGRVRWIYEKQPEHLKLHKPIIGKDNKHRFGLTNGSQVSAFSATASNVRGLTAKRICCEELAHWDHAEEAWTALIGSIADKGGQLVLISTANGRSGKYYDIWQNARNGKNDFRRVFFPWWTNPERDQAWYDKTLRTRYNGDLDQMHQEFPADEDEMFVARTGAVYPQFRPAKHVRSIEPVANCPFHLGVDWGFSKMAVVLLMQVTGAGRVRVYDEVIASGKTSTELGLLAYRMLAKYGAAREVGGSWETVYDGEGEFWLAGAYADPSEPGDIKYWNALGIPTMGETATGKRLNPVKEGITRVRTMFAGDDDGILIDPRCETLIEQLQGYRYKENTINEEPLKENDHAPDALRYGVFGVLGRVGSL